MVKPLLAGDFYESKLAIVEVYKKLDEAEAQVLEGVTLLDGEEVF